MGDASTLGASTLSPLRHAAGAITTAPALTIACHPDVERVGERALCDGTETLLARSTPVFFAPGAVEGRPLVDRHVSRRALRLTTRADGIVVRAEPDATALVLDGTALDQERFMTREALERGAVLVLAERVVLLLHFVQPLLARAAPCGLFGEAACMHALRRELLRVAPLDLAVLLRGETGTGKELAARAIHDASTRARGSFVTVNVAAIPAATAAAAMFGHTRGAFTGATEAASGYFGRADGGTLFLDEIGEAPIELQALLLRALESGEVQPVGDRAPHRVDVRVLAATDADLDRAVAEGRFRRPLLERLRGYDLELPPLRARREDVGRLLLHFIKVALGDSGTSERLQRVEGASPWLPAWLVAAALGYDWPGNVRELRNFAVRLAVAAGSCATILPEHLRGTPLAPVAARPVVRDASPPRPRRRLSEIGDAEVRAALAEHGFRPGEAAVALGVAKSSLYQLIRRGAVRKASDLVVAEIHAALAAADGDVTAAAGLLAVSTRGLRLRMRALGLT